MHNAPNGTLYIIAAPSGTGKTSLVKALTETMTDLCVSISHTTRTQRAGEEHGKHYFFISEQTFVEYIHQGTFLEYARVYDYYYGTSKDTVLQLLNNGQDVILEIDWQGAAQVRQLFSNSISIFILPPSRETLRNRLNERAQDAELIINKRMAKAAEEITHYHEFDYLIINDNFNTALADLQAIIHCQRLRTPKQAYAHAKLLQGLLAN